MPRCARTLLKARAAVDAVERNGASSLLLACQNGHDACVELLLEHSADPNLAMAPGAEDGEGQFTPLITAAKNGRATVVRTLLQAGAHRDAVTIDGATPLVLAQNNEHSAVVEFCSHESVVLFTCVLLTDRPINAVRQALATDCRHSHQLPPSPTRGRKMPPTAAVAYQLPPLPTNCRRFPPTAAGVHEVCGTFQ